MNPNVAFALASIPQTVRVTHVLWDRFLFAKLRTGDEFAWKKVFPQLHPLATGIAYNLVQSRDDAEDISMEVLAELARPGFLENIGITTLERLRGYLAGMVRNKAKDFLRKKTAQRRGDGKVWNFSEIAESKFSNTQIDAASPDNLHHNVEMRETESRIHTILKELPEKEKILVEGFYMQGHTYQELSNMHGFPIGTIGVYLSRALVKMRTRLKPALLDL